MPQKKSQGSSRANMSKKPAAARSMKASSNLKQSKGLGASAKANGRGKTSNSRNSQCR